MSSDNWVGFAKSPKPDPNLSRLRIEDRFELGLPAEKVFQLVTSAQGLSSWLQKTEKSEVRTSGKIKFTDVAEDFEKAVFSLVDIGRRVVINSELFGEIEIVFEKKQTHLSVAFTKMVSETEVDDSAKKFRSCLDLLASMIGDRS